ncbi:MAG: fumarylacetoacetate hydrolase family protein [Chloroflexota bacterium]|nr:fumarylacetoacetate hydrolase family protein [Chloroflexota bacterium]
MRLVTYSAAGHPRLGAMLHERTIVDLNRASGGKLPADMVAFLNAGADAMAIARTTLDAARAAGNAGASATGIIYSLDVPGTRLEAPVPRPPKVLGIGLNYRDHADEGGQEIPKHPVVFAKMPTCIVGPGVPVHRPRVSATVDWEGELCIVIGEPGRHIAAVDAPAHVAGYMNGNDVSVREWQFHSPTWMIGKSFDTHGPIGPWLVTADEVNATNLDVKTFVNGQLMQDSNTKHLIFGVGEIIEYLSTSFTLEPGDVIFTGTPAGVGVARKPPVFLKDGDVVRVEISGLGVLENPVIDEPGLVAARSPA